MVTVVRELGAGSDVWRVRESRDGSLGFKPRLEGPRDVLRFRYDESQGQGTTYVAYEANGRLWAVESSPERSIRLTNELDLAAAGAEAPKVVAGESSKDHALITQDGTWYQHTGPVGGANPETTPDDGSGGSGWVPYPDPNVDGVPGNAGESYAFAASGHLLVFWNAPNGDLMVARRDAQDTTAAFEKAQMVATGGDRFVDFVHSSEGGRLVTQAADGTISLWGYANGAWFPESLRERLPETAGVAEVPEVLLDRRGTLTIAWRETIEGGGLMLWQEERPRGGFLERPTFVPGTRGSDIRVVMSPRGTVTVGLRRNDEPTLLRVKHLPAGKTRWTRGIRLVSPKPSAAATNWALGSPHLNGDLRVAMNDRVGVYGFRFDAPRPNTKMTKPVRKVQRDRRYRVTANTTWAYAREWEMRARVDKGRRYGAWRPVALNFGDRSKQVTRPWGEKRCYSARADTTNGGWTKWSKQRCVTVRR
jgi:hypothetical protein